MTPLTELQALGQAFDGGCSHKRIGRWQADTIADAAREGPVTVPVCPDCHGILRDLSGNEYRGLSPVGEG